MTDTAVGTDFLQSLDVHLHEMAEFTLDAMLLLDRFAEAVPVFFGEILCPGVEIDIERFENLATHRTTDAIDIGERNFNALVVGQVDAGNTEHRLLSLTLFVLGVLADNVDHPAATHGLAVSTDLFYGGADFHSLFQTLDNPSLGQVVGTHVHCDPVPREESDIVHPHLARNVGEHFMPVIETDFEGCAGEAFDHLSIKTDEFFIISHILHTSSSEGFTLPTQKESGAYNSCVPQSCIASVYPLSRELYALFKCAHSVIESRNVVNKPRIRSQLRGGES